MFVRLQTGSGGSGGTTIIQGEKIFISEEKYVCQTDGETEFRLAKPLRNSKDFINMFYIGSKVGKEDFEIVGDVVKLQFPLRQDDEVSYVMYRYL